MERCRLRFVLTTKIERACGSTLIRAANTADPASRLDRPCGGERGYTTRSAPKSSLRWSYSSWLREEFHLEGAS